MLDSIRLLTNCSDPNSYNVVTTRYIRADSFPTDLYVQLWQSDISLPYMPAPSATVTIKFLRADTVGQTPQSQTVELEAEAPFADRSIWKVTLQETHVQKVVSGGFQVILEDSIPAEVINISGAGTPGTQRATNVVTITTQTAHGFVQGDSVVVAGVSDVSFNGTFTVASVPTTTTFTYAQTGVDATSGGGTVENAEDQEFKQTIFSEMSIRKVPSSQDPLLTDS